MSRKRKADQSQIKPLLVVVKNDRKCAAQALNAHYTVVYVYNWRKQQLPELMRISFSAHGLPTLFMII